MKPLIKLATKLLDEFDKMDYDGMYRIEFLGGKMYVSIHDTRNVRFLEPKHFDYVMGWFNELKEEGYYVDVYCQCSSKDYTVYFHPINE